MCICFALIALPISNVTVTSSSVQPCLQLTQFLLTHLNSEREREREREARRRSSLLGWILPPVRIWWYRVKCRCHLLIWFHLLTKWSIECSICSIEDFTSWFTVADQSNSFYTAISEFGLLNVPLSLSLSLSLSARQWRKRVLWSRGPKICLLGRKTTQVSNFKGPKAGRHSFRKLV